MVFDLLLKCIYHLLSEKKKYKIFRFKNSSCFSLYSIIFCDKYFCRSLYSMEFSFCVTLVFIELFGTRAVVWGTPGGVMHPLEKSELLPVQNPLKNMTSCSFCLWIMQKNVAYYTQFSFSKLESIFFLLFQHAFPFHHVKQFIWSL